jgi:hypothetical protein
MSWGKSSLVVRNMDREIFPNMSRFEKAFS